MADKLGEALRSRLQSAQDYDTLEVNFFLRGEHAADALSAMDAVPTADSFASSVKTIQQRAREGQKELLDFLDSCLREADFVDNEIRVPQVQKIESYWITNAVSAHVTRSVLQRVLPRGDVIHAELVRHVDLAGLLDARAKTSPKTKTTPRRAAATGSRALLAEGATGNNFAPLGGQFTDFLEVLRGKNGTCHGLSCLQLTRTRENTL